MPIPLDHMKERISVSYLSALAAKAGVGCRPNTTPEYGTDGHLVYVKRLPNGKYRDTGFQLNYQIKASTSCEIHNNHIAFDMEVEDYNKLAEWEGITPCVLILFTLPTDPIDWLSCCEDELILKRCCYWMFITGSPSQNSSKQRVIIPRDQVLTPDAITTLMENLRREELVYG